MFLSFLFWLVAMLSLRNLLGLFRGGTAIKQFAGQNFSLKEGIFTYAISFFFVSLMLGIEIFLLRIIIFFLGGESAVGLAVGLAILAFAMLICFPALFMANVFLSYIWGAFHFFLARYFNPKPDSLNAFNGSLLAIFASVKLVEGILLLLPVVGWVLKIPVNAYGAWLVFNFVKARFNLSDARAAIVVLVPLNLLLLFLLAVSLIVSFALIGSRLLI